MKMINRIKTNYNLKKVILILIYSVKIEKEMIDVNFINDTIYIIKYKLLVPSSRR